MKNGTLYMIGNAHIDPVWLWRKREGLQEILATFRSALDRMEEYPEFVFSASSAAFYEWVELVDPDMFERIRKRVAEGRWIPVGGFWVEPDCTVPSGESFVRQGLYAQRYFMSRFDRTAKVGWNIDSFGHNGMLPQILKGCGIDYYTFLRPGPHEKGLPSGLFSWVSPDGSSVIAFRILFEYCTWGKELEDHILRCAAETKDGSALCFYGVGNHGGGPTKRNLESIRELDGRHDLPRLLPASPETFFDSVAGSEMPAVHGELLHHASGCYAAHTRIKALNRKAEHALTVAERLSSMAVLAGVAPYPPDFDRAWKEVLFNQFHDILAGTSLEAAYEDAEESYGEALSIASRNLSAAVCSLGMNIDIPLEEGMKPIAVFNPHSFPLRAPVELESSVLKGDFTLVDGEGRTVPFQVLKSRTAAGGRCRVCFVAELPSFACAAYRLRPVKSESVPSVRAKNFTLENTSLLLEFDALTGFVKTLARKTDGLNLFSGPAARPAVYDDPSDTWSHNVRRFDRRIGDFALESIALEETGPVRAVIRTVHSWGASRIVQEFSLYNDLGRIDVDVRVFWADSRKALKLLFPVNPAFRRETAEIPYGFIRREMDGEEYPMQTWLDVSGSVPGTSRIVGLSFLNDSKTSCHALNSEIGITVLRSPLYAHHDPFVPARGSEYPVIDQGRTRFSYALLPHDGGWEDGGTVRNALAFAEPPVAMFETYHHGRLSPSASFLSVDAENAAVTVFKDAEDHDGFVLRAYETSGRATRVSFSIPPLGRTFSLDFGPCEIKTVRIPHDPSLAVREIPMTELEAGDA